ncbi:MAG: Rrf2 family transcriptional regulator [Bacteroidales bacterium]|nr:Rrf2 family transcriptional regulator [Bacteroidales bacterium]
MLSKTTEYAIRALVYIEIQNRQGHRPGFSEIAKGIESPEHFTAKILQTLTRYELVNSIRGRGGGFFFDKEEELTLYEVIITLEGEKYFSKCVLGLKSCDSVNPCPLHHEFVKIRNQLYFLVRNETIQSLASEIDNGKAVLNRMDLKKRLA